MDDIHVTNTLFGESMVEAICFTIESSHYLSFQKKILIGDFVRLG
jgi:hypothetical protein